jgi:hypothetical protein
MDPIQEQVIMLTDKVDALHQMIDQVNGQVSNILALANPHTLDDDDVLIQDSTTSDYGLRHVHSPLDIVSEHKDILIDNNYSELDRYHNDTKLSKDVQIQRLTAQLTAAYHRIAALEEQLLAARTH